MMDKLVSYMGKVNIIENLSFISLCISDQYVMSICYVLGRGWSVWFFFTQVSFP